MDYKFVRLWQKLCKNCPVLKKEKYSMQALFPLDFILTNDYLK